MSSSKGKILVIRGGAIGDFILTLPVLSALRAQFPETHLEVLGYPHIAQLAMAGGLVDQVQSIEARALAGFFARHGDLDPKLGAYFAEFALVFSYLYDPDEIFKTNLSRCSKAQFIAGPHRPVETANLHATATFLQPLERVAIFDADPIPRLALAGDAADLSDGASEDPSRPRRWLAVHPGSGSEQKNWPEANWRELLTALRDGTDLSILIVGAEAESERVQRLSALIPENRLRIAHNEPLVQVARLVAGCGAFIGHDSGITHLAAAVGSKVLVLWGNTNEAIWRPLSPRSKLVKSPAGLAGLTADQVSQELASLLKS